MSPQSLAPWPPCCSNLAMQAISAGPLQAIVSPAAGPEERDLDIVLLHGFGAPGTDLVGLDQAIRSSKKLRFFFLQAPHTLPGMSGPHAGRMWWAIDMVALQVARMSGQHDELAEQSPEGLREARAALSQALVALQNEQGLDLSKTVLGGFSQGAMLSCDWALRSANPPGALIQFSGTVICEPEWKKLASNRRGLRVFQSHAPDDEVLPYVLAERHRDNLSDGGCEVTFVPFRGGHGIGQPVLEQLGTFLDSLASE